MSRAGYFTGEPGTTRPIIGADGKPKVNHWGPWSIPLYEYQINPRDPLTFHWRGLAYQPDRHVFPTDAGSIPPFLWMVPGLNPWCCPRAYPNHDCGFRYGGLYICREAGLTAAIPDFRFVLMQREHLNELLGEMILADGAGWVSASVINTGVRLGSKWAWDEKRQAVNRHADHVIPGEIDA